jgi:hypothetical protein
LPASAAARLSLGWNRSAANSATNHAATGAVFQASSHPARRS